MIPKSESGFRNKTMPVMTGDAPMSSMSEEVDPSEARAVARNAAAGALLNRVTFRTQSHLESVRAHGRRRRVA
jgi:hypothetical protein